jgi:hypothetical protein
MKSAAVVSFVVALVTCVAEKVIGFPLPGLPHAGAQSVQVAECK